MKRRFSEGFEGKKAGAEWENGEKGEFGGELGIQDRSGGGVKDRKGFFWAKFDL